MTPAHVKWFDNRKGFGFLVLEDGREAFVHHSAIEDDRGGGGGFKTLREGQQVECEVSDGDKGLRAERVRSAEETG